MTDATKDPTQATTTSAPQDATPATGTAAGTSGAAPADGKGISTVITPQTGADATPSATAAPAQEDWRTKIIKHDEKSAERLNRFTSVESLWDSYRNLEQKLSSGSTKKELAADATPEQLSAWRKDNGVPEKPEDYDLKFDNGLFIGVADKHIIYKFLQQMHTKNAPNAFTKEAVAWYFENRKEEIAAMDTYQKQATQETTEALKKEWGAEKFDRNINIIKTYIGNDDIFNKIQNSVLPDGKPLASDKDVVRFLAAKAFEQNPLATVSTGSGMATGVSIQDEINKIEDLMGDYNSKYHKGAEAEGMQQRYRDLVTAREAMKEKK